MRLVYFPLVVATAAAVAHTQGPFYYSNQNQYFLHGLALAGVGDLSSDWLANTADPTPLFSHGVAWLYSGFGVRAFFWIYFALLVLYFRSLWGIAESLPAFPRSIIGQFLFAIGLMVSHSAIVRIASVWLLGVDYPWYFQAGVANQYLLGPGLQPSVFGVLLLAGLWAWVADRRYLAATLCAAACGVHSTYLLPAGLLVAGMMVTLAKAKEWKTAVLIGVVALLIVAPVLICVLKVFAPTDPESFAESQRILAWLRIPHHADVNRWLDWVAALQIIWAIAGLWLYRQTSLFPVLLTAAVGSVALSIVQVATGDATLALMFPWRISAVLVPVATVGIFATVIGWVTPSVSEGDFLFVTPRAITLVRLGAVAMLLFATAVESVVLSYNLGYQSSAAEDDLLEFVVRTRQPGEMYLLPTSVPKPSTTRGTGSATFVPVNQSGRPAVFELQRFRLGTGAACYVDFKSVPYKDVEVFEWRQRVANCERWYATVDWDGTGVIEEVLAAKATHVVVPDGVTVKSESLKLIHEDKAYRVYRIERKWDLP